MIQIVVFDLLPRGIEAAIAALGGHRLFSPFHPASLRGRSSKWQPFRKRYIKENPVCVLSGLVYGKSTAQFDLHHVEAVSDSPEKELDPQNVRTIVRQYHYLVGHFCDWQKINKLFDEHVLEWRSRIKHATRVLFLPVR